MKAETIAINKKRSVEMTAYLQQVGGEFVHIRKRPAVIILPGGGYQFLSEREAEPAAFAYLNAGYQVFILRYSIRQYAKWPNPLRDYEDAVEMICERSEEWGVDCEKIAVIGFSAGGHLAAAAATMAKKRPNAAILGYSVLDGKTAAVYEKTAPDLIEAVDGETPPCFLFATRTDETVSIMNSVKFAEKLTEQNISYECHIYSFGPHGFSTGITAAQAGAEEILSSRVKNWTTDSIGWLKEVFGDFAQNGFTEPRVQRMAMPTEDGYLSVDYPVDKIIRNREGKIVFSEFIEAEELKRKFAETAKAMGMDDSLIVNDDSVLQMKAKDILRLIGTAENNISEMNKRLRKIKI